MRTLTRAVLAAVVVAGLAACSTPDPEPTFTRLPIPSPTGTPTVMEDATVVWADGIEPTGELEDHPLVKTYRAAELGRAMAWNTGDFTIAQYTDNVPAWLVADEAREYVDSALGGYTMVAGWKPLEILSYDETGGGEILICEVSTYGAGKYDRTKARRTTIGLAYENGRLRAILDVGGPSYGGSEPCSGEDVPVGILDPAPTVPADWDARPFRPPLYPGWDDPSSFNWRLDE